MNILESVVGVLWLGFRVIGIRAVIAVRMLNRVFLERFGKSEMLKKKGLFRHFLDLVLIFCFFFGKEGDERSLTHFLFWF